MNEQPETEANIATGNFSPIKGWLKDKIQRQGSLYTPQELIQRVTGESLNPDHFIDYLKNKYREIYGLTSV